MDITRPTLMEVNVDNFYYNVEQVKKYINKNITIMPVIKANAYGTHINKLNDVINKFEIVAVANVDEAVTLRKQRFEKEIFILNQPYKDEINKIEEYKITVGVCEETFIDELIKNNSKIKMHLEIDTGMGRTGIFLDNIDNIVSKINQFPNLKIEGIYTHFSSADIDKEYTEKQIETFDKAVEKVKNIIGDVKYIHAAASNGILNFENSHYNMIRPGMILYGYEPFDGAKKIIDLKPVCKLKSKITYIKEVEENVSISYGRTYITNRKTKIATIPIGYADGIKRMLSNLGEVIIKGKRAPIVGRICMDSFMIDVTEFENINIGDEVYIWDNEAITVKEIAEKCNTTSYEILSTISYRVPRKFKMKGNL